MKNLTGLILLRWAIAFIFLTHACARIYLNTVFDFGELFLNQIGFAPFGVPIAWMVTIFELIGCTLLFLGKYIRVVSCWFIFQVATGIILVHLQEGWFVVGAGRNGFEYSFLIIASLLAITFPNGFKK